MSRTEEKILPPLWVMTIAGLLLVLWLIAQLREIVVLLIVGYSIAYVIDPFLDRLQKRGVSRGVAAVFIGVVSILGILTVILTAVPTVSRELGELQSQLPEHLEKLKTTWLPRLSRYQKYLPPEVSARIDSEGLGALMPQLDTGMVRQVLQGFMATLLKGYSITLTLFNLVLLPFIVYHMAVGFDAFHRTISLLIPRTYRLKVRPIAIEINQYISAFVRGQLTVATILSVLYGLGLLIVGVDLWLPLALISGFGNLIPYFGFLVGIVLSTGMALLTFGDFSHVFYVWIVYGVVQALEGTIITPYIVGDRVGLSPLTIIIFLFAGGKLFGLLGIFLAIPAAAALRVIARVMHEWLVEKVEIAAT